MEMDRGIRKLFHPNRCGDKKKKDTPIKNKEDDCPHLCSLFDDILNQIFEIS
jgi:hypothetical protein